MPKQKQKRSGMIIPSRWRQLINTINADPDIDNPKTATQLVHSLQFSLSLPALKANNLIIDGVREFFALQELSAEMTREYIEAKRERDKFLETQMLSELLLEQKRQELIAQSQNQATPAPVLATTQPEQVQLAELTVIATKLAQTIVTLQNQVQQLQTQLQTANQQLAASQTALTQTYQQKKTKLTNVLSGQTPFVAPNGQTISQPVVINNQKGQPLDLNAAIAAFTNIPDPPPMPQQFKINPDLEQRLVKNEDREQYQETYLHGANLFRELLGLVKLCEIGSGEGLTASTDINDIIICNKDLCYRTTLVNAGNFQNEKKLLSNFVDNYVNADKIQHNLDNTKQLLTTAQNSHTETLNQIEALQEQMSPKPRRH